MAKARLETFLVATVNVADVMVLASILARIVTARVRWKNAADREQRWVGFAKHTPCDHPPLCR